MNSTDLARWYSSKAKLFLREGTSYFQQYRYPECTSSFNTSIEFASKAICAYLGADFKQEHEVSRPLLHLSVKLPECKEQLSRAAWISSRWVGADRQTRNIANYGNQDAMVPATKIILRPDVEIIKSDAIEVNNLLDKIENSFKFKLPIKLGILNGFVDDSDKSEKPCEKYPFSKYGIADWESRFSQIVENTANKYSIEKISISKVSNEFALIINPFGEEYPEKDMKKRFAFNILKNYIEDGGILVNIAGFPFFYAWDVVKGAETPVVDEKTLFPSQISIEGKTFTVSSFSMMLNFTGSLLWRELEVITSADTPKMSGINELEVFQNLEDKELGGDLIDIGGSNKVHEFRAIRKESKNLTPLLRVMRPDFGEVYPIAAVHIGYGYLICCGMNTIGLAEFEKIVAALDNFCRSTNLKALKTSV